MTATLNLDKPRQLKFTLSALRKFKSAAGMPLWKARTNDADGVMHLLDPEVLTWAVWAALLHDDPKVSFDKVEALLQDFLDNGGGVATVYGALRDAFDECGAWGLSTKSADASKEETAAVPNG